MGKLLYPDEGGVLSRVLDYLNKSGASLNEALNNSSLLIPSDFPYVEFLRNLPSTIGDMSNEQAKIISIISSIDSKMTFTLDNVEAAYNTVDKTPTEKRDRLIK